MRRILEISILAVALVCAWGCGAWSGFRADDEVVASVGETPLYRSELAAAMPSGLSAQDSVAYAEAYIDKWIVGQLKQEEAAKVLPKADADIERLVQEYRRSLLIHRLDSHYLDAEPCGEISKQEIEAYYNAHKADFCISTPMVKGEIVAIAEDYRRLDQLVKWFESSKEEHRTDFVESCRKNNFPLLQFNEWVSFSDFLSNLPLVRTSQHEDMLSNRKVQRIHYNKNNYYYRITAVLKAGDTMPLDMAEESIRHILIGQHRAEVIRRHEERLKTGAFKSGYAKINK
jgi:hypothetical protein